MSYPPPPYGGAPEQPPTTPHPVYQPAYPYGYPGPPEPPNQLLNIGGALAMLGGLIIGLGWLAPTDLYWVILGIGWLMFGPGLGMALLGLGRKLR